MGVYTDTPASSMNKCLAKNIYLWLKYSPMAALDKDLQKNKTCLNDFRDLTLRILQYLPDVISGYEEKKGYRLYYSDMAGTKKHVRPIKTDMFIQEPEEFSKYYELLQKILHGLKKQKAASVEQKSVIDKTLYTIQQATGAGLDLMVNPNSARKHVGNRFEELIKAVITEMGITNERIVLQIPYKVENEETKIYKCENDLIISPFDEIKSTNHALNEKEIVVSVKTTSKDRMGKIFIDKILLERFVKHPQRVIGIFLNDVQRKENNNISYTLVSGLFMVYTNFLTKLDGIYYFDLPPTAEKEPFKKTMKPFSELITNELHAMLSS